MNVHYKISDYNTTFTHTTLASIPMFEKNSTLCIFHPFPSFIHAQNLPLGKILVHNIIEYSVEMERYDSSHVEIY
jgi:hypothetical protein